MSKNTSIADLRMIAGHPALELANTVSSRRERYGPDLLVSFADLVAWGVRAGVLDAAEAERQHRAAEMDRAGAASALERAKLLREALYRLFSRVAAELEPVAEDLALLSATAQDAAERRVLSASGARHFAWQWRDGDDVDAVSCRVALLAADLLVSGDRSQLSRIKECFGPNCGWLFLDTSRNGHRRWCSDDDCGVQMRVRQHRARRQHSAGLAEGG